MSVSSAEEDVRSVLLLFWRSERRPDRSSHMHRKNAAAFSQDARGIKEPVWLIIMISTRINYSYYFIIF